LYQRIVNEGHTLGNHTYSHNYDAIYPSVNTFEADVDKLNRLLVETTGVKPNVVRFPGGSNNTVSYHTGGKGVTKKIADDLHNRGYQYFDWNVDSTDASAVTQSRSVIIQNVISQSKNQSKAIILMHDSASKTTTAAALEEIINGLKSQGFEFRRLSPYSYAPQFIK
jgi:peptidoglycan/xylan/chitin deacetylase (PgdA/CDA1 family)